MIADQLTDTLPANDIRDILQRWLRLDKQYLRGKGDWLWMALHNGAEIPVLDLVGSYGINLLGHNHQELCDYAAALLKSQQPVFTQVSQCAEVDQFQQQFAQLLNRETGANNWQFFHSNTGTEAVEVALKIAWLAYQKRKNELEQQLHQTLFQIQNNFETLAPLFAERLAIPTKAEALAFYEQCLADLQKAPFLLAVEKAFHGKTAGALSAMGNEWFRQSFPTAYPTVWLSPDHHPEEDLDKLLWRIPLLHRKAAAFVDVLFYPVFGFVFETIQGEGGLRQLDKNWLQAVCAICANAGILRISDEIQCGLFRTGYLAAAHGLQLKPDIYCFAKALGGGIAKIGLTVAHAEIVPEQMALLHSSSFAADSFSIRIAIKTLEILQRRGKNSAVFQLKNELDELKKEFPDLIESVNGLGYMLGIQFKKEAVVRDYAVKFLDDLQMAGYWLASVLLERERVRVLPTLSAPYTFRIQVSLCFGEEERQKTMDAFRQLCSALREQNRTYLWDHIFPGMSSSSVPVNPLPDSLKNFEVKTGGAFFICHPVDLGHLRQIVPMAHCYTDEELEERIQTLAPLQKFTPYHKATIYNTDGVAKDVVFMGIPLVSKSFYRALRSGNYEPLVAKIQEAVHEAEAMGAATIGLGQFSSIISQNGTLLHSQKARLTTGNAFTVSLCLQALHSVCAEKGLPLSKVRIALVGATGNILSVMATSLAGTVQRMILVQRKVARRSAKEIAATAEWLFALSDKQILKAVSEKQESKLTISGIEKLLLANTWNEQYGDAITLCDDMAMVKEADVLILGTNSVIPILTEEFVKPHAIVIDVAVPPNADKALRERADVVYLNGGMARLPEYGAEPQQLHSVIFPFDGDLCFGCMAETIGLSFDPSAIPSGTIGELDAATLQAVTEIVERQGFRLGGLKQRGSF